MLASSAGSGGHAPPSPGTPPANRESVAEDAGPSVVQLLQLILHAFLNGACSTLPVLRLPGQKVSANDKIIEGWLKNALYGNFGVKNAAREVRANFHRLGELLKTVFGTKSAGEMAYALVKQLAFDAAMQKTIAKAAAAAKKKESESDWSSDSDAPDMSITS